MTAAEFEQKWTTVPQGIIKDARRFNIAHGSPTRCVTGSSRATSPSTPASGCSSSRTTARTWRPASTRSTGAASCSPTSTRSTPRRDARSMTSAAARSRRPTSARVSWRGGRRTLSRSRTPPRSRLGRTRRERADVDAGDGREPAGVQHGAGQRAAGRHVRRHERLSRDGGVRFADVGGVGVRGAEADGSQPVPDGAVSCGGSDVGVSVRAGAAASHRRRERRPVAMDR
jgi:hypothetical protein